MKHLTACSVLSLIGSLLGAPCVAQEAKPKQDLEQLKLTAEQFLQTQASQLPGQVSIDVNPPDKRLNLPACSAPVAFFPNGSKAWGKTTVGVRCLTPSSWTIFMQASVKVQAQYVAAAVAVAAGQQIHASQLMLLQGDLTSMPGGVITDMQQVLGKTSAIALAAGAPLRQEALRKQNVVQQGQIVKLVSNGPGFSVSAEARAINSAADGQMVQVKTASGQQISGMAMASGVVQVNY